MIQPANPYPRSTRFIGFLERWNTAVLLGSLLLALAAGASLFRLRLDMDLLSMLPRGSQRFTDYRHYIERFGAQDLVVAVVRAPDAPTAIRFADAFVASLRTQPEILAVRHRIDLTALSEALRAGALPRLLPLDVYPEIEQRLTREGIEQAVATMRRVLAAPGSVGTGRLLASDPLGLSRLLAESLASTRPDRAFGLGSEYLLSPDGTRLAVLIRPARTGYEIEAVERLTAIMRSSEEQARATLRASSDVEPGVSVGYTGAFAYARHDQTLLRQDMILYMVVALAAVLAVFYVGYRNLRILPFVSYHMLWTTLLTFALGLFWNGQLNAVSLSFAAIFYGLSIDAAIHFYTRFLEERDAHTEIASSIATGMPPSATVAPALAATVATMLRPTIIAATTTSAAFVAIGFSDLAGVAQLGDLTAVGMLLNVAATFTLLPALTLWLVRHTGYAEVRHPFPRATLLARLATLAANRRATTLGISTIVLLLGIWFARHATLDTDLFHLRPTSPAAAVQTEIEQHFGISDPDGAVLVEVEHRGDPALVDAALATTERVTRSLEARQASGLVRSVVSPAALLPSRSTQEKRLAAWASLPRAEAVRRLESELEAQGFAVEPFRPALQALLEVPSPIDASLAPLPGLELLFERHLRRDSSTIGVLVPFAPHDGRAHTGVSGALAEVAEQLPDEVGAPAGVRVTVTGRPLMQLELHATMRWEIALFLAFTLASNAALIWLRERSLTATATLLAGPAAAVVLILAVAGALGVPITPVNLIVLPLTIGIGVDNCVYLAESYRETGSVGEAIALGGRAVAITTGTTIAGFGVLGFSRYPGLSGLGWLAAASLVLCFLGAILVLPAFLTCLRSGTDASTARAPCSMLQP